MIFLSSRTEVVDRILGLELGGDDYVPKPFSPREVASRIKAVLRRRSSPAPRSAAPGEGAGEVLSHGALEVDVVRHEVRAGKAKVDLTPTEFEMLRALLESPGRLLSRTDLISKVYKVIEEGAQEVTERTVDTYVRRIRAKFRPLGMDPIETVHGLGYKARDLA